MTNFQKIFDIVSKHLLIDQRKKATYSHPSGNCFYRVGTSLKCAIGVLIHDELYDIDMEDGFSPRALYNEYPDLAYHWITEYDLSDDEKTWEFMKELQLIHDGSRTDDWGWKLNLYAHNLNLDMNHSIPLTEEEKNFNPTYLRS